MCNKFVEEMQMRSNKNLAYLCAGSHLQIQKDKEEEAFLVLNSALKTLHFLKKTDQADIAESLSFANILRNTVKIPYFF